MVKALDVEVQTNLNKVIRTACKYSLLYLLLLFSVVLCLSAPKTHPKMAWFSSGSSNAALIANLKNNGLIQSEKVAQAMLGVCMTILRPKFHQNRIDIQSNYHR